MINPSLTIYKQEAKEFINVDFDIEKLDGNCNFTEGPVWNSKGFYLFSDIPENIIYKLQPGISKEIFLQESGFNNNQRDELAEQIGSNGLAYNNEGNLLICQHGNGAVAKFNNNTIGPFITSYHGKPFNSPNDIIVDEKGRVFFSDPPYGLKDQKLQPGKAQPVAGLYCWDGDIKQFWDKYQYPNGVCITPAGKTLITCSTKPFEKHVLEFDIETLQLKRTVCNENSDGVKCDRRGNIYLCTKEGIVIVNNNGERLAKIELETTPANCCWGGDGLNDLFITARQNVFLVRNLQKE